MTGGDGRRRSPAGGAATGGAWRLHLPDALTTCHEVEQVYEFLVSADGERCRPEMGCHLLRGKVLGSVNTVTHRERGCAPPARRAREAM